MNTMQVKKMKKKLYALVILINLVLIFVTYKVMPLIQNYPPNSENIAFQKSVEQFSHVEQYLMIFIIGTGIHIFTLNKSLKNVYKFLNKYYRKEEVSYEEVISVRKDCITVPYKFYLLQIIIVLVLGMALTLLLISDGLAILKFFLMLLAITTLIEILQFIFIQKALKNVMIKTYKKEEKYEKDIGLRLSFSSNLILQIIPFLAVSIIIISLIGYAKANEEYSNTNASYYKAYLSNVDLTNINADNLIKELKTIPLKSENDYFFILAPKYSYEYLSKDGTEISDFFKKYLDFYFKGTEGIVYEFYGTEQQAFTKKLKDNNNSDWYIGFEYSTADNSLMTFYVSIILSILLIYTIFIYILAKNISNNIVNVSNSLKDILEKGNSKTKENLPILSNDEIGDLSYYYNKIQEKLIDQQDIISIQSKFSAIGEVAAGMAHDINSPASAIDGTVKLLYDFKVESNEEEYKILLDNMKIAIDKILKIVNNARDQFRNHDNLSKEYFTLNELLMSVKSSEEQSIVKRRCSLNIKIDKEIKIYGVKTKLYQVIVNLIRNSLNAYMDNNLQGEIFLQTIENNDEIIIQIQDSAGGIPEEVKDELFNKILTTRGTKGTGLRIISSI